MSKRNGLGRGLGSLLSSSETQYEEALPENHGADKKALEVEIGSVRPNPWQPRKTFDKDELDELADSIREHGIIQPLIVRRKGLNYELVAGERRLRAAKLAKLKTVPVLVRDYTEQQMQELALVENIQRRDLNPLEEAQAIRELMKTMNYTQAQVAAKIGRSRAAVANLLRMLQLPSPVRKLVADGTVTAGQIRPVLALDGAEQQTQLAEAIVQHGWSARTAEEVVKAVKEGHALKVLEERADRVFADEDIDAGADGKGGKAGKSGKAGKDKKDGKAGKGGKAGKKGKGKAAAKARPDVHYQEFEEELIDYLGTKVRIVPKNDNVGTIEIEYYSPDDLDRLVELLQQRGESAQHKDSNSIGAEPWLRTKFHV
jgi:ParB family chromosome partitioning protein